MSGVVHIGIDAGCFEVLDRLADVGVMPRFGELRRAAGSAVLTSTEPWFTVPGWVSLMTGVPAGRHGLISWTTARPRDVWVGGRDRFVGSTDIPFPTVFEVASAAGRSVASINMPVTFPPSSVNGVVVSGFPAPLDPGRVCRPTGFLDRYPDYAVDVEARPGPDADAMDEDVVRDYVRRLVAMTRVRARVVTDLLRASYDLISVVFVGPDRLLHVAWPAVEHALDGSLDEGPASAVAEYYRALDAVLGALLDAADGRLVLVTSDHGQRAPSARSFVLNAWLEQRGLLVRRSPSLTRIARAVPAGVRRPLWWALRQRRDRPLHSPPLIDWARTKACGVFYPHCQLYGIAVRTPESSLTSRIESELLAMVDPQTGERPFDRVVRGAEWLDPDVRDRAPELVVYMRPGWGVSGALEGDALGDTSPSASGEHTRDGLLVASGPGVAVGDHARLEIVQVAATLLEALDVPAAADMAAGVPWIAPQGRDQAGTDREGGSPGGRPPAASPPETSREGLSRQEEEEMTRHLEGLGYV
jgi:predicted AlkP superfamily phosphohydrolase/phosphomutase